VDVGDELAVRRRMSRLVLVAVVVLAADSGADAVRP
jgi:hypothetical protein